MIRLISLSLLFLTLSIKGPAQDVFSLENSKKFAQYLYDSGQYDLAADEFERVIFMAPKDSSSLLNLFRSYRFGNQYSIGLQRSMELIPDTRFIDQSFLMELYLFRAHNEKHNENLILVRQNEKLNEATRRKLEINALMLDKNWEEAETYYTNYRNQYSEWSMYGDLFDRRSGLKKKNPYLAAGMSMVIPGLGKVYTNNWADGLISFLFVATNAWQAYRGFNKDGIGSVYGWVFGSIGTGFWLGNVFGSYKSGKKYNELIDKNYYDEVKRTVYSSF